MKVEVRSPKVERPSAHAPRACFVPTLHSAACLAEASERKLIRAPESQGFTMIEIAISLAIIGFALAAIIGILPMGMNVQKENRQQTIINQDCSIWMDAFRNGERGVDDLTNYVMSITNFVTIYNRIGRPAGNYYNGYIYTGAYIHGATTPFGITNGFRIIGLLSTPKIIPQYVNGQLNGFLSNHVVALVRSMSGPASEKAPQENDIVRGLGLNYRLIADVTSYGTNFYDPSWTNYVINGVTNYDRLNYWRLVQNLQTNLHDVRLTFRWPLRPNGDAGPSRQVYRTTVGGEMFWTNEPGFALTPDETLFFFRPRTYAKAP